MSDAKQLLPPHTYNPVARWLHWLNAILALVTIMLAWSLLGTPRHSETRGWLIMLHGSLGMTILAVMILWAGWRLRHASPPLRPTLTLIEVVLARTTQSALFLLFVAMP
ncbi:MAG TPA: cytochrome b/b6 domain-containing protein, partial [Stellaceae bacterium]|nr:cytochrome b/b6 domain-containing protein [Stellaceae bacterium]